ncbi:PLP-dependent aminotransferase family protein [Wukongibacter baidiensis]|uniref:MocR-like pyridoxine biosynthesis transcription factor PdxR n=1 Tax=Wukongibacter baidiensis TaxID=1723361 RepID=UPI003D7F405C
MRISINRKVKTPIYLQIKNQIRDMIFSNAIVEGFSLPPERKLAEVLGVNRSTVIKAYQELKADGLIGSHVGKGTVVLPQIFSKSSFDEKQANPMPWYQLFNETTTINNGHIISDIMEVASYKDIISLAGGIPAPDLYPIKEIEGIQSKLFKNHGKDLLLQSPVEGYYPLRESISSLLRNRQIEVSPREVMVLSGSQQGLDFAARIFIRPGDTVIVEEPTFFGAIQLFRAAGARVIGVPIDENGIRTDILEPLLVRHKPKFIYTLPTFQNPSGVTMSLERRYELLNLAYQYQIPILEDDPYGEIRYDGISIPPLKALDRHGYVMYLSTFSKVLCLGLRVGWIVAPQQVLSKFAYLKQITDLHVNTPSQWILDRFIRKGLYEKHIKLIGKEYAFKRNVMIEALERYKVQDIVWNEPEGGYYIWCRLPKNITQTKLIAKASNKGVVYVPGEAFYPYGTQGESYIRLNYTYPSVDQIEEGIKYLMEAVKETLEETKDLIKDIEYYKKPIV